MTQPETNRRDFLNAAGKTVLAAGLVASVGAGPLAPPDKQPPDLKVPPPAKKKLGFAIVGLGELAVGQILPAFAQCESAAPVALVSGHRDKAEKIAARYGIDPKNIYDYQNYDTIKDNPAVDVIYIVLPNHMHAEYTVRGFGAGKHVLCEKPMAASSAECRQMIDAGKAAGKKLMIAYRLHYEPYNKFVIELMRSKQLGEVKMFAADNMQSVGAPNIRLSKSTAGGPLGDVGIYCLNAARYVTGEEPIEVFGKSWADPNDDRFREVPSHLVFTLQFPSGATAHCSAGFDSFRSDHFAVTCEKGALTLEPAFGYTGHQLKVAKSEFQDIAKGAGTYAQMTDTTIELPRKNHFTLEMDDFAECVTNGKQSRTPGEEGLKDMVIIEAIKQSKNEGRAVKL